MRKIKNMRLIKKAISSESQYLRILFGKHRYELGKLGNKGTGNHRHGERSGRGTGTHSKNVLIHDVFQFQAKRLGSLNKFKGKDRSILIATDVASR